MGSRRSALALIARPTRSPTHPDLFPRFLLNLQARSHMRQRRNPAVTLHELLILEQTEVSARGEGDDGRAGWVAGVGRAEVAAASAGKVEKRSARCA